MFSLHCKYVTRIHGQLIMAVCMWLQEEEPWPHDRQPSPTNSFWAAGEKGEEPAPTVHWSESQVAETLNAAAGAGEPSQVAFKEGSPGSSLQQAPPTKPMPPPQPVAPEVGNGVVYTSTNFRKEYSVLQRVATGPRAAQFSEVARMFKGTAQERQELLKSFVQSGCNLDAVNSQFETVRKRQDTLHSRRRMLTVRQMRELNFSEQLALTYF